MTEAYSTNEELLARRARVLGARSQLFYDNPVHVVRGEGVWLFDAEGERYLDGYNNVAHVGHCHPRVVEALCRQASLLNTHTRYLHTAILDYVERLMATMDGSISTAILTCTGSEANDVALRMAQACTGKAGIIATDGTYHGNTTAVSQLSMRMPPVGERLANIRLVRTPDSYRQHKQHFAAEFADAVGGAIASLEEEGHGVACLIIDPFMANEGVPDLPSGFFDEAIRRVRKAGGVVITDEVQPGFGRTGRNFWGHQKAGLVPDIVTMGKPMGNGHPIGCAATTPSIMAEFRNAFRYFNTFGGNPVSCAVGNAVLYVLEEERLMENAHLVGEAVLAGLRELSDRHRCIGDVRGSGLFLGAELIRDGAGREPALELTDRVVNAMRQQRILIGKTGIHGNVLKIRPPMPFSMENAEFLIATLDQVLAAVAPTTDG